MALARAPLRDSSALRTNLAALRQRAAEDGYLFLPGLLPPSAVLAVRGAILEICHDAGWCDRSGCWSGIPPYVEGQPEHRAVYEGIQRLEIFHRLAVRPELIALYAGLFGEAVLAHPRNIARVMFPQNNRHATPAHQDGILIRGTPETWTAWIPLGEIPADLGGLALLAGSHHESLLATHPALGAGGLAVDTAALPYAWVGGDMAAGDVLTFHSRTVHQALPNGTPDRMRLSADFRYQPASHPVAGDSLLPHMGYLTWEQIYAGWSESAGQYYWREGSLTVQ